ncbi:hypothetical protein ACWCXX_13700 [Streptomyces sp. NPDC001732]
MSDDPIHAELDKRAAAAYHCTATVEYLQNVPAVHNRKDTITPEK